MDMSALALTEVSHPPSSSLGNFSLGSENDLCCGNSAAPLCSAALLARRQLLLLRSNHLIQKMTEITCSLAAFPSSSSCTALVTLGHKSWHECRDALQSLCIFISRSIALSVSISSAVFGSTLKTVLAVSQKSL